jgi:hypothetical protein
MSDSKEPPPAAKSRWVIGEVDGVWSHNPEVHHTLNDLTIGPGKVGMRRGTPDCTHTIDECDCVDPTHVHLALVLGSLTFDDVYGLAERSLVSATIPYKTDPQGETEHTTWKIAKGIFQAHGTRTASQYACRVFPQKEAGVWRSGLRALTWIEKPVNDTLCILTFAIDDNCPIMPREIPPPEKIKTTAIMSQHHDPRVGTLVDQQYWTWGRWRYYETHVLVDRGAIEYVSSKLVGKERTGKNGVTTFNEAIRHAQAFHKNLSLPPGTMHDSIMGAASLGFYEGVKNEINLYDHAAAMLGDDGVDHLRAMSLVGKPTPWRPHRVLAGLCGGLVLSALAWKTRPTPARLGFAAAIVGAAVSAFSWVRAKLGAAQRRLDIINDNYNNHNTATKDSPEITHGQLSLRRKTVDLPSQQENKQLSLGDMTHDREKCFHHMFLADVTSLPVVFESNGPNEAAAIVGRIHGNPLKPEASDLKEFAAFLSPTLTSELPLPPDIIEAKFGNYEACYAEWNALNRVTKEVAKAHDEAGLQNYITTGVDYQRVGFVKIEQGTGDCSVGYYKQGDPRLIQDVSAQVHVAIGPFFYAFGKHMSSLWDHNNWLCYASGVTAAQAAQYCEGYQTFYVGDVSRFDRSLHQTTLKALNAWRKSATRIPKQAWDAMVQQEKTRGITMKGRHKYKADGQRKSGDDNTSCDNTLLNIMAHVWAVYKSGVDLGTMKRFYRFIALGDDIVICGPSSLGSVPFKETLALIGWNVKPKVAHDLDDIEFCSRFAWPSDQGRCFAAKPARLLCRFPFSAETHSTATLGEKAFGLMYSNSHVPFVRAYLARCLELDPVKPHEVPALPWEMKGPGRVVDGKCIFPQATAETWRMFTDKYGLTEDHEREFVQQLKAWQGGPAVWNNAFLQQMNFGEGIDPG